MSISSGQTANPSADIPNPPSALPELSLPPAYSTDDPPTSDSQPHPPPTQPNLSPTSNPRSDPQPLLIPERPLRPSTLPSPAQSIQSLQSTHSSPSIRDFAHPPDTPEHVSPSPTIEPSATRSARRLRLPPSYYSQDDLPSYQNSGAPQSGGEGGRCQRYPQQFRTEDDYLSALAKWAEGKMYMEPPKDGKGRSVGIEGFYGEMRGEDYVRRESRRKEDGSKGAVGGPENNKKDRPGSRRGEDGGETEGGQPERKRGLAGWVQRRTRGGQ